MAHEIETAMYVGKPAWHGLGQLLATPPATTDEAVQHGGLDWLALRSEVMTADGFVIPDVVAVRRDTDGAYLGTVGKGFKIVQNGPAFARFQPLLDSGQATIEACGSLRGGRRVWMLAKLAGDDLVIVPRSDDRVEKYLLFAHGHDGSLRLHLGITGTRVVCANTLSVAMGEGGLIKIKHTRNADQALDAGFEVIAKANTQFAKAAEIFRALASVNVRNAQQIHDYIDIVFPAPAGKVKAVPAPVAVDGASELATLLGKPLAERESFFSAEGGGTTKETRARIYGEIETLFAKGRGNDMAGVKGTAWAAYNAVTEYITHERGRNADNRMNTAWFGSEGPRALQGAVSTFLSA